MRTVIAHGHIFKNAGTTLDWSLKRQFGDGFCNHCDDKPMRQLGAKYLEKYLHENPHIRAISSHHLCDVSKIQSIKMIPIYMIRHPIERALSVYNFERLQQVDTPGAIAAKKYDFKDYIKWRMEPEVNRTIRNFQTFYLSGEQHRKPSYECNQLIFTKALEKINSGWVGIVDAYNISMVKWENKFLKENMTLDLSYIRQNSSDHEINEDKVLYVQNSLNEIFPLLMEQNAFDLCLYQVLVQNYKEEDVPLAELKEFEKRCIENIVKAR